MEARVRALQLWLSRLERRSTLPDTDRAAVLALPGRTLEFAGNRDVVKLGERSAHCCLVADGLVARFGQTAEGVRQLTAFYLPGDMGDLHAAVLPKVTSALQTLNRATVVQVVTDQVRALAARSPTLAEALWRDSVADALISSEWMLNLGRRNARSRVAHLICELACRFALIGRERERFPLEMTQSHLADATGLTSVHVNRTLRQLREERVVEVRGNIASIHDWTKLRAIADFDPSYLHLEREPPPQTS